MNKMKLVLTKIGIAFSALAMIVAFNGASSGFAAGSDAPEDGNTVAGTADTSATVTVPPWCGWNINPVTADITLTPAGSYIGEELVLSGSTTAVNAYVGGTSAATSAPVADNCSWFGKTEQAASFEVSIGADDDRFTAKSGVIDDSIAMGWELSEKPLVISNDFSGVGNTCTADGFTPNAGAAISNDATAVKAWSIVTGAVDTNNFCNYSVDYTATIPAGKNPTFGASTYTFTGPSLIHTLTTE
jgi:hypothetical protein